MGHTIHHKTGGSNGGSGKSVTVTSTDKTITVVETDSTDNTNFDLSKVITSASGMASNYLNDNFFYPVTGGPKYYKIAEFEQIRYDSANAKLACVFDMFSAVTPNIDSLLYRYYFNCRDTGGLAPYKYTDFKAFVFENINNVFPPNSIVITVKVLESGYKYSFAVWGKSTTYIPDFKVCFGQLIDGENIIKRTMYKHYYNSQWAYTSDDITTEGKEITVLNIQNDDGTSSSEKYTYAHAFVPTVVDLRTASGLSDRIDTLQKEIDTLNINVNGVIEPFEYLQADSSNTFTQTDVKTSYALSVLTKSAIKTNNIEVFVTQNGVKNLRFAIYDSNLKLVTQTATYDASSASKFVNIPFTNVVTLEQNTLYYIVYGVSGNGINFIGRTMTFVINNLQPALYSDPNAFNEDFSYKDEYGKSPISGSIFVPYFKIY
jgi:hypothetical protein